MGRLGLKRFALGRHRTLLFRSYLFLAAALLTVAAVLDFGFGYLESSQAPLEDRWLESTYELVESELASVPPSERAAAADTLGVKIGVGIRLLTRDDIASTAESLGGIDTLVDGNGNRSYLREAPALNGLIRLGPIEAERDSIALELLPPLFYLSIFVVVGLWLRPILKDLDLITDAAQRFAADYREPLSTARRTTQLTGLASNLDDMSARLSGLIQSQKELIAALSHEMRTPLARIRFALAVIGDQGDDRLDKQLDELNDDVQEIDRLIATMLNYARLDHPDLRMNWLEVPLEAWLKQIGDRCRHPDKSLTIDRDEAIDTAWMDPGLMALALSNLLSNAHRYAERAVTCRVFRADRRYAIAVEDDGKGIPESEWESVFKAFKRLDDSRNRETGGYGLGLAIVARIAALHGGEVTVSKSAPLGGAKFVLSWPPPAA